MTGLPSSADLDAHFKEERIARMKLATQIVHWPGQSTAACDEHTKKLKGLASVLGFPLSTTPANSEPCANCESESKVSA